MLMNKRTLTYNLKKASRISKGEKWGARPFIGFGLFAFMKLKGIATLEEAQKCDWNVKPDVDYPTFKEISDLCSYGPCWNDFVRNYIAYFNVIPMGIFQPCPGQQSLETVMEENEPVHEPPKVEKSETGAVLGDTPNNLKPPTLNFVDVFNKGTLPIEIDGKLYKPHLELIDVNSDQN